MYIKLIECIGKQLPIDPHYTVVNYFPLSAMLNIGKNVLGQLKIIKVKVNIE